MLEVVLSTLVALGILLITEKLSRQKKLSIELSRKIPHIVGGIAIATWPFFVGMDTIVVLGALFFIGTLLVRKLNLFAHARSVDRRSWGEPLFALGITLAALMHPANWVFVAAVLYMALADAAAALAGKSLGKHGYQVLGQKKTVEGSVTFLIVATIITAYIVFIAPSGLELTWPVVLWLPLIAMLTEAAAPFGIDNIAIPLLVAAVLSSLQSLG
jgi:phytol kinase